MNYMFFALVIVVVGLGIALYKTSKNHAAAIAELKLPKTFGLQQLRAVFTRVAPTKEVAMAAIVTASTVGMLDTVVSDIAKRQYEVAANKDSAIGNIQSAEEQIVELKQDIASQNKRIAAFNKQAQDLAEISALLPPTGQQ